MITSQIVFSSSNGQLCNGSVYWTEHPVKQGPVPVRYVTSWSQKKGLSLGSSISLNLWEIKTHDSIQDTEMSGNRHVIQSHNKEDPIPYSCPYMLVIKNASLGASLVAQWLRVCLPMQGTRVRALVWEDPMCRGATGPVSHNYWACASGACAPQQERPR